MKWKKLGRIFNNAGTHPKLLTHASNPVAILTGGDIYRIFYSGRDSNNRSSVSFFDYDIQKMTLVKRGSIPLFTHGDASSFYSHGVSIGSLYCVGDECHIAFMGWHIYGNEHWMGRIGQIAVSAARDELTLNPIEPFMDLDQEDPISLSYPWIIYKNGVYKMWYGSTCYWDTQDQEMLHVIKYAESNDGQVWKKYGTVIPFKLGQSQAFSRPSVIWDEQGYHMWFSYRGKLGSKYRIGYSTSFDGITWVNDYENVGIDVSVDGWDSQMICYPFVFSHKNARYMLYNGNEYGKSGIGLAVMSE